MVKFKSMGMAVVMAAMALGAMTAGAAEGVLASADVGKTVPVIQTERVAVTQVVVGDTGAMFLMATEQPVKDVVVVTPEMAKNAMPYRVAFDAMPPVTSDKQVHNAGKTVVGNKEQFSKTGRFEPITTMTTQVNKLYFEYGSDVYYVETVGEKAGEVTLTYDLIASATKMQ